MYLPRRLYTSLPVLYLATGALTALVAPGNFMAATSAAMLLVAGVLTSFWRFRARARIDTRATARLAFQSRRARRVDWSDAHVG